MGMNTTLMAFPIFVLIISMVIGGGAYAASQGTNALGSPSGSPGAIGFNNLANSTTTDCSAFISDATGPCYPLQLPTTGNYVVSCKNPAPASDGYCYIEFPVIGPSFLISPLQENECSAYILFFKNCDPLIASSFAIVMPQGTYLTVNNGNIVASTKNYVIFGFGSWTALDLVVASIGVIVTVAAVVGLNVFGSGEASEAIHMLLMGGIFLGIWVFFSGLEGFIGGSPSSFFVQLNGALPGLGTFAYFMLALMYLFGFIKTVSRGAG